MGPLPVLLVTGFLGSGKTTLLRRMATQWQDWRGLFLVNELAAVDVDAAALAEILPERPQSVVGGSLFCECKAGEFLRVLRETVLPGWQAGQIDGLIIETSGMADPGAIGSLFQDHGLTDQLQLHGIVAVATPARLPRLYAHLEVVREQLRHADWVVLNQCDRATAEQVAEARALALHLNPLARLREGSFCQIDLTQLCPGAAPGRRAALPTHALATCDANPFSARVLPVPTDWTRSQWEAWLADLPAAVLRLKGLVPAVEGWLRLEKTVDEVSVLAARSGEAVLVAMVHDDDEPLLSGLEATPPPSTG